MPPSPRRSPALPPDCRRRARVFALMVVRDAADLLPVVLRHHLAQGVARFLVLDHGSADATPDVLRAFAVHGHLQWTRVEGPFCKRRWIDELALEAFLQGADWVLPLDADELWTARGGTLADTVAAADAAALEVAVVNFVQQHDQAESSPAGLLRMVYRVAEPAPYGEAARRGVEAGLLPFVAMAYPPKWIARAAPGLSFWRGAHGVEGVVGRRQRQPGLCCLHAPLRSRSALARRRAAAPLDPRLAPGESWHLGRWLRMPATDVEAEWAANSAAGDRLAAGGRALTRDTRLRDAAQAAMGARWTVPRERLPHDAPSPPLACDPRGPSLGALVPPLLAAGAGPGAEA